jgi:hypothetical protein
VSILKQNRHNSLASILFVLSVMCAPTAISATSPDDYIGRARQLLRALYPELSGRLRPVIIGHRLVDPAFRSPDLMNTFTMLLYDFELGITGEPARDAWCADPPVRAFFGFDWQTEQKELYDLEIYGPLIDGDAHKFAVELAKRQDWSDTMIATALKDAGAKFGPEHKAEFLRSFPREQLRPFMAGDLEVVSAEFHFERNPQMQLPPKWIVLAKWHSLDGRESNCTLAFEPFHGYLTTIMLTPVVPKPGQK